LLQCTYMYDTYLFIITTSSSHWDPFRVLSRDCKPQTQNNSNIVTNIAYFNKKHVFTRAEPLLCLVGQSPDPHSLYNVSRESGNTELLQLDCWWSFKYLVELAYILIILNKLIYHIDTFCYIIMSSVSTNHEIAFCFYFLLRMSMSHTKK